MTIRLYAMTCGWLTMSLGSMLVGEKGTIKVPVPSYLVRHPRGDVLFDTGLHPSMQSDPSSRLGALAPFFEVHFERGEDVAQRLAALQVDPARIAFVINSHLHFDHCGGNASIPNARLVVQRKEWDAAHVSDLRPDSGFNPQDFDHGHDRLLVDGVHDLFGDGTVVCIPTHGHTPGHQSLQVKLASGDVVLTGDACYLRRTLEEMRLPVYVHDADQMRASLARLRDLQQRGARIFYGHDPEFWAGVPQAPAVVG